MYLNASTATGRARCDGEVQKSGERVQNEGPAARACGVLQTDVSKTYEALGEELTDGVRAARGEVHGERQRRPGGRRDRCSAEEGEEDVSERRKTKGEDTYQPERTPQDDT